MLSVTERAVHGASISLAPWLWLNTPNSLACSRLSGLNAALPGADNSRMHWKKMAVLLVTCSTTSVITRMALFAIRRVWCACRMDTFEVWPTASASTSRRDCAHQTWSGLNPDGRQPTLFQNRVRKNCIFMKKNKGVSKRRVSTHHRVSAKFADRTKERKHHA